MKSRIAQRLILIFLALVLLPVACTPTEATHPALATTASIIQMTPLETVTSLPVARTDCDSRYPSVPAERTIWPKEEWTMSTLEEHCLDRAKVKKAVWHFEQNYATSSLLIVRHGELVYENYFFRTIKPERRAQFFSITKSFLSAMVGIAMDQDLLASPDHKVIEYFPEYFLPHHRSAHEPGDSSQSADLVRRLLLGGGWRD